MKENKYKRKELISILSAWKSDEKDFILSDVIKYIEKYINKDKDKVNLPDFNFVSFNNKENEK
jgi:hypothetical protein|tara:strand:- start:1186 stop:1374 length:189 start_codon:yes stop_codon:yes gene_type:complete